MPNVLASTNFAVGRYDNQVGISYPKDLPIEASISFGELSNLIGLLAAPPTSGASLSGQMVLRIGQTSSMLQIARYGSSGSILEFPASYATELHDLLSSLLTAWASLLLPPTTPSALARRRMYDVRDYLGNDDYGAAVNRAIAAAQADAYVYGKPGQVVMTPGSQLLTSEIVPVSGVDILGAGSGKTVLVPKGAQNAIHGIFSAGTPLTDVTMADFEIDGSQQSGTYNSSTLKGIYTAYHQRCRFEHLYIHDTGATGLGTDHFIDSFIEDIVAINCGRLGDSGTSAGAAGVGIGTSSFTTGLQMKNIVARNNKRAGLFWETQDGTNGVGVQADNVITSGNGDVGIGDAGVTGLQISNAVSSADHVGFKVYAGSVLRGAGQHGTVRGMKILSAQSVGMYIGDTATAFDIAGWTFDDLEIASSVNQAILTDSTASNKITTTKLANAYIHDNGKAAVQFVLGTVTDFDIANPYFVDNGTTGTNPYGIMSSNPTVTGLRVRGGKIGNDNTASKKTTYALLASGTGSFAGSIDGTDVSSCATGPLDAATMTASPALHVGFCDGWTVNAGAPAALAPVGTLFRRTDGGATTTLYVKETGSGTTGWTAK